MAALDVLILGGFIFTDFAVPDSLPFGGRQQMHVHKFPGGGRVIDTMGPDDDDRHWKGTFWGSDALGKALTLDAMRRAGDEVPYSNGVEARLVVISAFEAQVEKFNVIHYSIAVTPSDSFGGPGQALVPIGAMVLSDIASAVSDLAA